MRASAWLVILTAIFLPVEWLFAVRPRRLLSWSTLGDVAFYFISGLIPALILGPLVGFLATSLYGLVPWKIHALVTAMPIWARAGLGLVVCETGFYWGHRWAHEIPLLWRFHAVHHQPEEIYFLVSSRAHPLDNVFIRLCGFVPAYALGIATPLTPAGGIVSAILAMLLMVFGFFIHANVRWRFGILEWIIATPGFHHWHHTRNEARDKNFASMLPVMDLVFGTWHLPKDAFPAEYGTDTVLPRRLLAQLVHPFLRAPAEPVREPAVTS